MNLKNLVDMPIVELVGMANDVREKCVGRELDICSIVNAKSGRCSEDCKFCAQSGHHKTEIDIYGLKDNRIILEAAKDAKDVGAQRFGIVTSGNKLSDEELDRLCIVVSEIVNDVGIAVCGSLGALSKDQLRKLKEAGMSRYHHNIETSPRFYPEIVSTHKFDERIETIKNAKEFGFEVCSGGIIGLGETWQDRIDMALILKDLKVDSVPLNILVPVKGTKLENIEKISANDAVRTIAIFRIILKNIPIKIAAGRESVLKDHQALGFLAGATGMLIGGYLTVKGRSVEEDRLLVKEIKELWKE